MMSPFLPLCSMAVLLFLLLIVSPAMACDRCVHKGKAAFFSQASVLQSGACGYGSLAPSFYGGRLSAAVPGVYRDGAGCGVCFQIRCKNPKLCTESGTTMIVTDLNQSNETDFVLSSRAFGAMAKQGMDRELFKLGTLDVEYKRVPCEHKRNLAFRVEESSQKPHYLAVKVLYQGGQTEIVALDVSQAGSGNWKYMARNHGAVWDTSRVPAGALEFRMVVTLGYDGAYHWAKNVLPADWKNGVIYDSGLQITDIAQEGCSPCDTGGWGKS